MTGDLARVLGLIREGEIDTACHLLERGALGDDGPSVSDLVTGGKELFAYGHPNQAVALLEIGTQRGLAENCPDIHAALPWLGLAYLETKSWANASAIHELTRCEDVVGQLDLLLFRARWLHREGHSDEVGRLYLDGLTVHRGTEATALLLIERGCWHQQRGELDDARVDWRQAERMAALVGKRSILSWCRRLMSSEATAHSNPVQEHSTATPAPRLYIHLLGDFLVVRGQETLEINAWSRHKAVMILQYLALQPRGQAPRERVLEAIWGEEASPNALYVTIHSLRQGLAAGLAESPNYISLHNGVLGLVPALYLGSDLQQFRSCIQAARAHWGSDRQLSLECYRRAASLYKGELLTGSSDHPWLLPLRETVRQMAIEAFARLAQNSSPGSSATESLGLWLQLIEVEPGHEEAVREVMLLQWRSGQKAAALRCFANYTAYAQKELGTNPTHELLRLQAQIDRS